MSPPSTVHSELFSGSMTSVDTSQSEETLHQGAKSGTSQTTSFTVNMAARTWSRRSGSSTIASKGIKLTQKKTPVVSGFFQLILFDGNCKWRARSLDTTFMKPLKSGSFLQPFPASKEFCYDHLVFPISVLIDLTSVVFWFKEAISKVFAMNFLDKPRRKPKLTLL